MGKEEQSEVEERELVRVERGADGTGIGMAVKSRVAESHGAFASFSS